jgi:micrococcal nuclease
MFFRSIVFTFYTFLVSCLTVSCDTVHPWGYGQGGRAAGGASVRIPLELPKKTAQGVDAQRSSVLVGRVLSVHDGDTIAVFLNGRKEKIRLIGIDAPELAQAPWGAQAQAALERLVLNNIVRLETDITERDQYGRLLAYVYAGDTFVNLELLKQGQAALYTVPPNVAHVAEYQTAQAEAREAGRGIWNRDAPLTVTPHCYRKQRKGKDCEHVSESLDDHQRIEH